MFATLSPRLATRSVSLRRHTSHQLTHKDDLPPTFYDSTIDKYCKKKSHQQSLLSYKKFGAQLTTPKLVMSAKYVQRELPIRIARELKRLQTLPWIMVTNPHIEAVHKSYWAALKALINFPPVNTAEDDLAFTELLKSLVKDTLDIVEKIGHGVSESKSRLEKNQVDIQSFLDAFLISRIARRVLVEQHIMLHYPQLDRIGIISPTCSPKSTIVNLLPQVNAICEKIYLNGITQERFPGNNRGAEEKDHPELPPVRVLIAPGDKDITIRVSDTGGGIPQEIQEKMWRYGFTTAKNQEESQSFGLGDLDRAVQLSPIAGLGFGLPLSRLHAKHFGGDLKLIVMEGYGTDAHLRLDRSGNALEAFDFISIQ